MKNCVFLCLVTSIFTFLHFIKKKMRLIMEFRLIFLYPRWNLGIDYDYDKKKNPIFILSYTIPCFIGCMYD